MMIVPDNCRDRNVFVRFLKRYCLHLSGRKSFSYKALAGEVLDNARLFEPFCAFCVFSGNVKPNVSPKILEECAKIQAAGENWPEISSQYKKLFDAWQFDQNKSALFKMAKQDARELICKKYHGTVPIADIARSYGISYSALYQFFRKNNDSKISIKKLWDIYQNTL